MRRAVAATGRAYSAVYQGPRDNRGGLMLDVDLGFWRWRRDVVCTPADRATRTYTAALTPGTAVTATLTRVGRGRYAAVVGPWRGGDYTYPATMTAVHDGDTFTADLDAGLDELWRAQPVRVAGINCRELADPGGVEARDTTAQAIVARGAGLVTLHTVKPDKYGARVDAHVRLGDGTDLAGLLIVEGWAAAWDGKGPKPVPAWPIPPPS